MRRCAFCFCSFEGVIELTDLVCVCGECLMKPSAMGHFTAAGWTLMRVGDVIVAKSGTHRQCVVRIPLAIVERLLNMACAGMDVGQAVAELDTLLEEMTDGRSDRSR